VVAIAPGRKRVSHETELITELQRSIADLHVPVFSGQGAKNKFDVLGWELPLSRQFQNGDLRIEAPTTTVIVEAESGGGVTNLVKYWPLLRSGDYIAHRKLWSFLVDRMAEDLTSNSVGRPERWDAQLATYRKGEPLDEVTTLLRRTIAGVPECGKT